MALSAGQVSDAFSATGKTASAGDISNYTGRGDLEGSSGQERLIQELGGYTPDMQLQKNQEAATKAYTSAIQPAVASLQASIPEVATNYDTQTAQVQAEKDPLIARYQALIDQINGSTQGQVNATQTTATNELGKRGIPLSSTAAQQEIQGQVLPIQQAGQANVTNTTLDREEKLKGLDDTIANLNQQKIASERDITNTIAQIQASAGTQAAQQAFQMFQVQQQATQDALDRAIQERQLAIQQTTATAAANKVDTASVQGGLYDVTNNKWIVQPKDTSGGGSDIASILAALNSNKAATTSNGLDVNAALSSGGLSSSGGWSIVQ